MNTKALRAQRAKLVADFRAIYDTAETETRALNDAELQTARAINDDIERLKAQIDLAESADLRDRVTSEERAYVPETQRPTPAAITPDGGPTAEDFTRAMDAYLRRGAVDIGQEHRQLLSAYAQRNQNTISGEAGGFLVRPDTSMYGKFVEALKFFGGARNMGATSIVTSTGAELPIPTDNDTDNEGEIVSEEGTHTGGTPVAVGQRIMKAYVFSSKVVKVSMQLLQDSEYDLEAMLIRKFGLRIGRSFNRHATIGDGVNKPQGYIPAAQVGKVAAAAASVTFDELMDLVHSVDIAYRANGRFTLADTTALAIRKLKDGNGVYRWEPGLQVGAPDRLLGYAVTINNNVPAMAANARSMSFGDHSAVHIRDVRAMRVVRLNELYAENAQVGFLAFSRHDAGLIDAGTGPIKVLQQGA